MRPNKLSYTPAAADLVGYAENVSGATWALTATTSADEMAHLVTIRNDAGTDHSAKTAILTGTDPDGKAQTETLALPAGTSTVTGTKHFKALTSVVPSSTIGVDTMDIGWSAVSVTPTYPLDAYASNAANAYIDISGTIDFTGQQSFANIWEDDTYLTSFSTVTAFSAKTADTAGQMAVGATAMRVKINSVTTGATLAIYTSQPSGR